MDTQSTTPVNGCSFCGNEFKVHGIRFTRPYGIHYWVEPTDAQRNERALASRGELVNA